MELTNSSDPRIEVMKAIEVGDNSVTLMRGMLWATLMLNEQLSGIRLACEDIAAGLLFGPEPTEAEPQHTTTLTTAADLLKRFVNGDMLLKYQSELTDIKVEDNRTALVAAQLLAVAEASSRIASALEAK